MIPESDQATESWTVYFRALAYTYSSSLSSQVFTSASFDWIDARPSSGRTDSRGWICARETNSSRYHEHYSRATVGRYGVEDDLGN